ncbi:MAG: DNA mismatch repair protein MutS [Lentisphaeria bacterium]|nr:DNA mismatch repair protein MutS [Lentisphaeria bacterium]
MAEHTLGAEEKLTPMMKQYREAKAALPPDAVLLFRLGDFYEEFFEDAERVSKVLELVLTKRQGYPMCGFPYHALESYLPRLIAAGLKVGIAEQMEDPKLAQGLVKRQITRIVTPGTVTDGTLLDSGSNNFLAAAARESDAVALALLDVSTGEFSVTLLPGAAADVGELARFKVRECLAAAELRPELEAEAPENDSGKLLWTECSDFDFDPAENERRLCAHFRVTTLDGFGLRNHPGAVAAAGAVLAYATESLRQEAGHVTELEVRIHDDALQIDAATLRNLEILESRSDGGKTGSLLGVLDRTSTAMGARLLRSWLLRPLRDHDRIVERADAVEAFVLDPLTLEELRETAGGVRDLERITGRVNIGSATPRDLQNLAFSLGHLPGVRTLVGCFDVPILRRALEKIGDFTELTERINATIADNPPVSAGEGGVIRTGFSPELDELRSAAADGKNWLSQIQQREIERTGIKSLKVKYNSVFGYYIEVSRANLAGVPEDYIRKQTLVNAERFITPELKELENRILGAEEKSRALEIQLFAELREYVLGYTAAIQSAAAALAEIDALAGLAECARINHYRRPRITDSDQLRITGGRHPVLEQTLGVDKFVPNDTELDGDLHRLMLLTGPNMAGKSTYIRQVALLVVMAQIGSFIPAEAAEIGIADRLFTRIGASDDLSRNQSTFMVEMVETANILRHATARSLVILDEIGRGTSTFDGLSIAWSVAEFLHDEPQCRTLFATHYHELTELAATRRGVNNYNVAVKEYGDDIIFLRQIVPGACDRSYGIHVGRLAGLPEPVLERANEILELLERNASAPRDAIVRDLERKPVRRKRRNARDEDAMIQLKLL